MKPPAISLFTGAGGWDLGMCENFDIRLMTDSWSSSIELLKANWTKEGWLASGGPKELPDWYQDPEPVILQADINELTTETVLKHAKLEVGECMVIYGSPPCQGISNVGKKNDTDPRNDLWRPMHRIVAEARPQYWFMENVPRITKIMNGEYIKAIEKAYKDEGYTFEVDIINCKDYGIPQNRRRAIMRGQLRYPYQFEKFFEDRYDTQLKTFTRKKS